MRRTGRGTGESFSRAGARAVRRVDGTADRRMYADKEEHKHRAKEENQE